MTQASEYMACPPRGLSRVLSCWRRPRKRFVQLILRRGDQTVGPENWEVHPNDNSDGKTTLPTQA